MKPRDFLPFLLPTTISAAVTPRLPRQQQQPLALLHTLPSDPAAAAGSSNSRLLAASTQTQAKPNDESTQGGAVLRPPGGGITSAHATLRIPPAAPPTTGPTAGNTVGVYAASFWVGIDTGTATIGGTTTGSGSGATTSGCGGAVRAGVDVFWDGTVGGEQRPFLWYQFLDRGQSGKGAVGFEELGGKTGDLVRFTLTSSDSSDASSPAVVVVLAENFGGNVTCADAPGVEPVTSVKEVLPMAAGGTGLCGGEAVWAVEDPPLAGVPGVPVAFANFTSVAFGGAGVTLWDGNQKGVAEADVLDIRQQAQGGRLTSCEVVGGKKVKCTRVVGDD